MNAGCPAVTTRRDDKLRFAFEQEHVVFVRALPTGVCSLKSLVRSSAIPVGPNRGRVKVNSGVLEAAKKTGALEKTPREVAPRDMLKEKDFRQENEIEDDRGVDDITFAEENKHWKRMMPRYWDLALDEAYRCIAKECNN